MYERINLAESYSTWTVREKEFNFTTGQFAGQSSKGVRGEMSNEREREKGIKGKMSNDEKERQDTGELEPPETQQFFLSCSSLLSGARLLHTAVQLSGE